MEKSNREYSKPRMVMEKFVPQEYCAGCNYVISVVPNNLNYIRIDWDENDHFTANNNERTSLWGSATSLNIKYFETIPVNVYQFRRGGDYDSGSFQHEDEENGLDYTVTHGTVIRNNSELTYGYTFLSPFLLKYTYGSTVRYYLPNGVDGSVISKTSS